jgi:uncharacterized membrane protein YqiK
VRKTDADAENEQKIEKAKTDAESLRIAPRSNADTHAAAILTKAKATAEAIRLKAAAEVQQDEMLSHTSWDQQESLLASYSDMVFQSNNGVEKIVDIDPNLNCDSPFAMEVSTISTWTCVLFQILVSQPLPSTR